MDFLVNSITSNSTNELLGIIVANFDSTDYRSRADVSLYSMGEFTSQIDSFQPSGFSTKNGALLSDTRCQRVIGDDVFLYMQQEWNKNKKLVPDIIDLVLQGVAESGLIVVNYKELGLDGDYNESGILIPFKNFRVSNSSFNIYASYLNNENEFRSYSLLELEDGSAKENIVAFPFGSDLSGYGNVTILGHITIDDQEYCLYSIHLGLSVFYTTVGEAFLNYLAYAVAYYNIGEKTLKQLAPVIKTEAPVRYSLSDKPVRKARVNVSLVHGFKQDKFEEVSELMGDRERLENYIASSGEAAITFSWMKMAMTSPWYVEAQNNNEKEPLIVSCSNLLIDCRKFRLKYALELLCHRYYIYSMGRLNDTLGYYLQGGGVYGKTTKWLDF